MKKIYIIHPELKVETLEHIEDEILWLKVLQAEIGGYIELAPLRSCEYYLLVNEDGLELKLKLNEIASILAGTNVVGKAILIPQKFFC